MNDPLPEDDLRELFARQRAADHERIPPFSQMPTRVQRETEEARPAMPIFWRWVVPGIALVALSLTVGLILRHPANAPSRARTEARQAHVADDPREDFVQLAGLTAWQSPTDFLLNPTQNENTP